PGTMSVSFSINRNGARCGNSFLMSSTFRTVLDSIDLSIGCSLGPPRQHCDCCELTPPLLDRARGNAAVILSAGQLARSGGGPRGKPGAIPDLCVIGNTNLPPQNDEVAQLAAA